MSKSRDWEMTKDDRARQMNLLDELIPDDAFQDADITENLTGKAPKLPTYLPPKGGSSIDG
jgi:hypothetical protein